jgi:hypothetical protein
VGIKEPVPPKPEWLQLFPFSEVATSSEADATDSAASKDHITFKSGNKNIPGSAMMKPAQFIGFVCVQVEVYLSEPAWKLYVSSSKRGREFLMLPEQEVRLCLRIL